MYKIGLPNNHGSLFWTGQCFSPNIDEAKLYATTKGARVAITRLEYGAGKGRYVQICGDEYCADYALNPDWWLSYKLSANGQLSVNFPDHPDSGRYRYR